jgi:superfamily I DNA and/or RNA helicase
LLITNLQSPDYSGPLLLGGQNLAFLDINGVEKQARSGSFENYAEAQAVVKLVQDASRLVKGRWQSADRIRIITFYMAQVSLIKRLLHQSRMSL